MSDDAKLATLYPTMSSPATPKPGAAKIAGTYPSMTPPDRPKHAPPTTTRQVAEAMHEPRPETRETQLQRLYPSMSEETPAPARTAAPIAAGADARTSTAQTSGTEPSPTSSPTASENAASSRAVTSDDPQGGAEATHGIFEGFQAPRGATFDMETAKAIEPALQELGFSKSDATRLAQLHERFETLRAQRDDVQAKRWEAEARNHPELRKNFEASLRQAQGVLDRFGADLDDLRDQFNRTPLGSHPQFVLLFARVARALQAGTRR